MLDQTFEALRSYDWGTDPQVLRPIDEAIVATHCDALARKQLEDRLITMLGECISLDAKEFVCRKLKVIGTAAAAPALGALLPNAELSHMARYALESMPNPKAGQELRDALPLLSGVQLAGVIGSLGVRQDVESVAALAELLADADPVVAQAAAHALGAIRSGEAANALAGKNLTSRQVSCAAADASLACAESLLADGDKQAALAIYTRFAKEDQPKHMRLAATRGMLACRS